MNLTEYKKRLESANYMTDQELSLLIRIDTLLTQKEIARCLGVIADKLTWLESNLRRTR